MAQYSWTHFYIPSPSLPCEMIVVRDQGILYYFANSIAWCLGHSVPHQAVQQFISPDHKHHFEWISGTFLKDDGIQELIQHSDAAQIQIFLTWYQPYHQQCLTTFTSPCPS